MLPMAACAGDWWLPGTPLLLMFKLYPSGALRGYGSGGRSPFCPDPWSHAAVQHTHAN